MPLGVEGEVTGVRFKLCVVSFGLSSALSGYGCFVGLAEVVAGAGLVLT